MDEGSGVADAEAGVEKNGLDNSRVKKKKKKDPDEQS